MNSDVALYWVQQSLETTIMVVGPLLGAALLVGLFVSMFQAVTSMQEMTLSFIPKLIVLVLALVVSAGTAQAQGRGKIAGTVTDADTVTHVDDQQCMTRHVKAIKRQPGRLPPIMLQYQHLRSRPVRSSDEG